MFIWFRNAVAARLLAGGLCVRPVARIGVVAAAGRGVVNDAADRAALGSARPTWPLRIRPKVGFHLTIHAGAALPLGQEKRAAHSLVARPSSVTPDREIVGRAQPCVSEEAAAARWANIGRRPGPGGAPGRDRARRGGLDRPSVSGRALGAGRREDTDGFVDVGIRSQPRGTHPPRQERLDPPRLPCNNAAHKRQTRRKPATLRIIRVAIEYVWRAIRIDHGPSGARKAKHVFSDVDITSMAPRCALAISEAMYRPRPSPCCVLLIRGIAAGR